MKITLLCDLSDGKNDFKDGQTLDISDKTGKHLIEIGAAKAVTESEMTPPATVNEGGTEEPTEQQIAADLAASGEASAPSTAQVNL